MLQCICRSSTLASAAELYGRSGYDYLFSGGNVICLRWTFGRIVKQHRKLKIVSVTFFIFPGKDVAVNGEPSACTQDGAIVDK